MEEMQINWAAFAAAVVAQTVVGFLYYHPMVMGKLWAKANGIDINDMKPKNPAMTYGITLLFTVLFTMWLMASVTGPGQDVAPDGHSYHTFQHGIAHALIYAIMIMIPVFGTPALFEKRSLSWVMVHVGYWFLRMVVGAGILSMWR